VVAAGSPRAGGDAQPGAVDGADRRAWRHGPCLRVCAADLVALAAGRPASGASTDRDVATPASQVARTGLHFRRRGMTDMRRYRIPILLFVAHLAALIFGLVGLLIMLPNPELWTGDPRAVRVFDWSMEHAGATHIILGALAVFAWGVVALGWRKTSIFFVVSYALSLGFELFGTGTGWPFGNYEYTSFLGY